MSDEQKPNDSGEWTMPEPVFRSSEGHTPKPPQHLADEVDTLAPDSDDFIDQDDIDTVIPNVSEDDIDTLSLEPEDLVEQPESNDGEIEPDSPVVVEKPSTTAKAKPEMAAAPKGGCAKNIMMVLGVIAFVAIAVVVAAVYFLFYYRPAETGTF